MPTPGVWSRSGTSPAHDGARGRFRQLAGIVLVALVGAGCQRDHSRLANPRDPAARAVRPALEAMIASKRCDLLTRPECSDLEAPLRTFYEGRSWQLAWTTAHGATRQAYEVAALLSAASRHGLDPSDYDAGGWYRRLVDAGSASLESRARFDVALTIAAMRFARDIHHGRVDPEAHDLAVKPPREPLDLAAVAATLSASTHPSEAVRSLEPPHLAYRKLLGALGRYRALMESAGDLTVETTTILEPGSDYADAPKLAALLRLLGDLPPRAGGQPEPTRYEGALVEAVKRFQLRHGLTPDGRIGRATFRALNTPLRERVRQIELALERWRWAPREANGPQVIVNIPEYRLVGLDPDGRPAVSMRVVVGAAEATPTPFVSGTLEHVAFRPEWNVPESILTEEILPELDDDYLAEHEMEIVDSTGRNVPLSDEARAGLREGKLRLRQRPGPKNSLGPVKFQFPNDESIYLHGTPAQALFDRARRDFSHGCIRVEDPETLAAWLLRDQPGWTRSRIRAALAGDETQWVKVRTPTPILVTYSTVVVTENGDVRFFEDVYRRDEALDAALAKPRWLPEQSARSRQARGEAATATSRRGSERRPTDDRTGRLMSGM